MKHKIQLTVCLLLLFLGAVQAQVKTIKGTVTNKDGDPLPWVYVVIKGANKGTQTDLDGKYEIKTKVGNTLQFSFIGFKTESVVVRNQKVLNIVLKSDEDDIIFCGVTTPIKTPTALGIERIAKNLPYEVINMKGSDLNSTKPTNMVNNLSGRVAGLHVQQAVTGVGEARAVLRGERSVMGDNSVLYVIDGIPTYDISDFNTEDIETTSVLTGAAAALYGANAANGVILISTKKGTLGYPESSVRLSSSLTFDNAQVLHDFQDNYSNAAGQYTSWGNRMATPSGHKVTDFFRTGYTAQNTVSYGTNSRTNSTYISASSLHTQGVVPNSMYNRYNLFWHDTFNTFFDDLKAEITVAYTKSYERNRQADGLAFNPIVGLYLYPRGEQFGQEAAFERYDPNVGYAKQYWFAGSGTTDTPADMGADVQNPYWIAYRNLQQYRKDRYSTSLKLIYTINSNLDISARVKSDRTRWDDSDKRFASTLPAYAGVNGYYGSGNGNNRHLYADAIAHYRQSFWALRETFHLDAYAGVSHEQYKHTWERYGGNLLQANQFDYEHINPLESSATHNGNDNIYRNLGAFAQAQLEWSDYTISGTFRSDFPSQLIYQSNKPIISYSVGGKASFNKLLSLDENHTILNDLNVSANYSALAAPIRYSNWNEQVYLPQELQRERTNLAEVGIHSKWLGYNGYLNATLYRSMTNNQLVVTPLSSAPYTQQWVQAGEVENKGVEMQIGYQKSGYNRSKELVTQKIGLVAAYNQQEVRNYPNAVGFNHQPKWLLGLEGNGSVGSFGLGFLVTARLGGEVLSDTERYLDQYGVSAASAAVREAGLGLSALNSDYLYSATNVRLQEVSVTYKLKTKFLKGLKTFTVSAIGNNLLMLYNKAPFDPERVATSQSRSGYDLFMLPSLRSYGLNVNIGF